VSVPHLALLAETHVRFLPHPESITACVSNVASGYLIGLLGNSSVLSGDSAVSETGCHESGHILWTSGTDIKEYG